MFPHLIKGLTKSYYLQQTKERQTMKIIQISTIMMPAGLCIFGLGDDNKTYYWDASVGAWRKNWNEVAQPVAERTAGDEQIVADAKLMRETADARE